MRLLAAALVTTLLAGSALSQPGTSPEISIPQDTISLGAGQAQRLVFPYAYDRIDLTSNAVVEAKPITDRTMTLHGLAAGETILTVLAGGRELYSAVVFVSAEPGHLVKLYGTGKNDDVNAGHIAVMCNEFGCGRPDKDLPRPTVEVRRISTGAKDK